MRAAEHAATPASGPALHKAGNAEIRLRDLVLATPTRRRLPPVPDLKLESGGSYWLAAPSGHGKSTLAKAIAGLWTHGEGRIERPEGRILVLPQQPYLPLGSLRSALAYPQPPDAVDEATLRQALAAVGLEDFWSLDDGGWTDRRRGLSGGEQQRLALARALLQAPDWLVLDEATSALDAQAEAQTLSALRRALPASTLVLIAHRAPQGLGSLQMIELRQQASRPDATLGSVLARPEPAS
jgi:putative ATP-binding cassette transporter